MLSSNIAFDLMLQYGDLIWNQPAKAGEDPKRFSKGSILV